MPFCTNCGASVQGAFCTKCGTAVGTSGPAASPAPPSGIDAGMAMAPRKKTSPIIWILGIVAGLFVLFGIVVMIGGFFVFQKVKQAGIDPELMKRNPSVAAAKMIAAMNPDIEFVSVDEDSNRVTLRQKSTGKEVTMDLRDVERGKISFDVDGEGKMTIGGDAKLPSWAPSYPNAKLEGTFSGQNAEGEGGMVHFITKDSASDVLSFYERELKKDGFKITNQVALSDSAGGGILTGQSEDGRHLTVTVSTEGGSTKVALMYGDKR